MATREFLILTATEKDRPGLVAELSGFIAQHGCNVEDSRVVVLGGYAGLMFLISGNATQIAAVENGLDALERSTGLRAVARRIAGEQAPSAGDRPQASFTVTASAIDHEGIIHAITDAVRAHGGNILELETSTESAPMSGSPLFALRMTITLAEHHGSVERLRSALETLSRAQAIDIEIQPAEERQGRGAEALKPA
jgi:glycine cleavage system transcriptional repressor